MLFLLVCYAVGSFLFNRICVPFMLFWYANDFKIIIKEVDATILNRSSNFTKLNNAIDIKMMAVSNMIIFLTSQAAYTLICTVYVGLYYNENIAKEYAYYTIPVPKLEQYGNLRLFLIVNLGAFIIVMIISLELCALTGIPMLLAAICHNEVLQICQSLNEHSMQLFSIAERDGSTSSELQDATMVFRNALIESVTCYQRVTRIVQYFEEFFTILCLLTLLTAYILSICHLYTILTVCIS